MKLKFPPDLGAKPYAEGIMNVLGTPYSSNPATPPSTPILIVFVRRVKRGGGVLEAIDPHIPGIKSLCNGKRMIVVRRPH
jgi:hypothetical protein